MTRETLAFILIPTLAFYVFMAFTIGWANSAERARNCEYVAGDTSGKRTGATWYSDPLTLAMTGECVK